MKHPVTITYYLEVISSWCHWCEPAWAQLKERFGDRVTFQWRIALMRPEEFPVSQSQCEWFYRRSGTLMRSPYKLASGWFESSRQGNYHAPNLVAEAGRDFLGESDERIRLALAHAAVREGRKVGDIATAVEIAAAAVGLKPDELRVAAESPAVQSRVEASTAAFHAHQISQRPAFVIEDTIGDKAVFSGLVRAEPLAAAIEAMLEDTAGYASFAAHFGPPPSA